MFAVVRRSCPRRRPSSSKDRISRRNRTRCQSKNTCMLSVLVASSKFEHSRTRNSKRWFSTMWINNTNKKIEKTEVEWLKAPLSGTIVCRMNTTTNHGTLGGWLSSRPHVRHTPLHTWHQATATSTRRELYFSKLMVAYQLPGQQPGQTGQHTAEGAANFWYHLTASCSNSFVSI